MSVVTSERAKDGYLREGASYSVMGASLTETIEGARTVEALRLGQARIDRIDRDIAGSYAAERYTLGLRTRFFPSVETAYLIPTVGTLLFGGWLYFALMESSTRQATLGKMALDMKVTDDEGNRISFGRATGRYFAKILSALILLIGFIMVAFTDRKRGLHDMIAGTLVEIRSSAPATV